MLVSEKTKTKPSPLFMYIECSAMNLLKRISLTPQGPEALAVPALFQLYLAVRPGL